MKKYFMGTLLLSTLLSTLFSTLAIHAMGDDKFGPHKGYIRMPGNIHTEVVPTSETKFKVYVLDIKMKTTKVKDTKIEVELETAEATAEKTAEKIPATCKDSKGKYFECELPKGNLSSGKLWVKVSRGTTSAIPAVYELPLKLTVHH